MTVWTVVPTGESSESNPLQVQINDLLARVAALEAGGGGTVTLGTLTASTGFQIGTPVTGLLTGKTAGSVIASNIPGIIVTGSTYSGTPTGSAAVIANAFVETLAGAVGSPKPSPATVTAAGVTYLMDFRLPANAKYLGAML